MTAGPLLGPVSETAEAPAPSTPTRRKRTVAIGTLGALGIAAGAVLGVQAASSPSTTFGRSIASPTTDPTVVFGRGGQLVDPRSFGGTTTTPGGASTSVAAAGQATADQLVGVVDIVTELGYRNGEAAGTGMVLTSDGEVLTNNHVVDGATSITVTVLSTGQTYHGHRRRHRPDRRRRRAAADRRLRPGHRATCVGRRRGRGRRSPRSATPATSRAPSAAAGTVTALDRVDHRHRRERLRRRAADRPDRDRRRRPGRRLRRPAVRRRGRGRRHGHRGVQQPAAQAYAIPIDTAAVHRRPDPAGVDNGTIHQGLPGVPRRLRAATAPAAPRSRACVSGGPADSAGLAAGDVITAIGGTTIASADDLTTALAGHAPRRPGDASPGATPPARRRPPRSPWPPARPTEPRHRRGSTLTPPLGPAGSVVGPAGQQPGQRGVGYRLQPRESPSGRPGTTPPAADSSPPGAATAGACSSPRGDARRPVRAPRGATVPAWPQTRAPNRQAAPGRTSARSWAGLPARCRASTATSSGRCSRSPGRRS